MKLGGEQRAAANISSRFIKNGHEVCILSLTQKPEKMLNYDKKIIIKYSNRKKILTNISLTNKVIKEEKKGKYDLVIGFAIIPAIICSYARIFNKTPVIICERNDPSIYGAKYKILRYIAYRFADAGIFQTQDAMRYFSKYTQMKK